MSAVTQNSPDPTDADRKIVLIKKGHPMCRFYEDVFIPGYKQVF